MGLCSVDAGSRLMAPNLEPWITVEMGLAPRMYVRHSHTAPLGGQGERAGQQKGC